MKKESIAGAGLAALAAAYMLDAALIERSLEVQCPHGTQLVPLDPSAERDAKLVPLDRSVEAGPRSFHLGEALYTCRDEKGNKHSVTVTKNGKPLHKSCPNDHPKNANIGCGPEKPFFPTFKTEGLQFVPNNKGGGTFTCNEGAIHDWCEYR